MARSPPPSDPETLFDLLADARRRRLIALLRESEKTDRLFLDALSAQLADREPEGGASEAEIAIQLHHIHLPKLDEAGLVRYDSTVKMVEFTDLSETPIATRPAVVSTED